MAYNPSMYMQQYGAYQPMSYGYHPTYTAQPVNGLVSVTGIEGAKAYQLPPNSSMPLFDQDNDLLYLKTTDSAGYPTIKTFAFKPMEEPKHAAKEPEAEYVPRTEFDALVEQVKALAEKKGGKDGK